MKAEEKLKLAHEAKESVNKSLGKNTVMSLSDKPSNDVEVISTGSLGLDIALGVGGLPKGRIIEIYGPESCLDQNSFIPYEIWDKNCVKRINHKGGSIKRLYERFHNVDVGEAKQGRHLQKKDIKIFVKSVNHENCIVRNEVLDVVRTGRKECYKISTLHGDIIATADHKFMTPQGFVKLSDLRVNDYVYIHNNTRNKGRKKHISRPEVYVKYHPKLPVKLVDKYFYHRGQVSRLTYEAYLNKYSLKQYLKKLNTLSKEEIQNFIFLPDNIHVHHIDENFTNNDISNLQLISPSDHGKLHANDRLANLSYIAVPTTITNIERVGICETYDIKCAFPYNNYIADGYVVHNCGKTTLAIHVITEAQKSGGICAIIDAEHAFDSTYAESLGVDLDRLFINQPDFGEQGLEVADKLIGSGAYDVVVIDSVAALVPKAELEGEMGDSKMGLHARLMSQACRKLTSVISKTNTICIFINQLRDKIGVMYGNPETTTGGNALKFYASVRLDVRRSTTKDNSVIENSEVLGNLTRVSVIKNKVAPPFKKCEFNILYGEGIDKINEIVRLANDLEIIKKWGKTITYLDVKYDVPTFEGLLKDNPDFYNDLRQQILTKTIHHV